MNVGNRVRAYHEVNSDAPPGTFTAGVGTLTQNTLGMPVDPGSPPYNGIVQIFDEIGGVYWQGSGVLLSPTEVLTASHVVWHTGQPLATNVTVRVGNEAPYGGSFGGFTSSAQSIHYNAVDDANDQLTYYQSQNDYAIITLSTPLYAASYFGLLSNYAAGTATVSGYPGDTHNQQFALTAPVTVNPSYTLLQGAGLGPGSSGGPVWITGSDGQNYVVGVVSTGDPTTQIGNDAQITSQAFKTIEGWLGNTAAGGQLTATDTTLNQDFTPQVQGYTGPVGYLSGEYINISPDNLNLTAHSPNLFLHSGAGEDAIQASSGSNVIDGGSGSNFLVGGSGADTFFTDDRSAASDIWDTLVNFHAGDAATIFGVTQAGFALNWADRQGATGYTGLTLHATAPGQAEASVTLAGYSMAALTNGQLTISFGNVGGSAYMYIQGHG